MMTYVHWRLELMRLRHRLYPYPILAKRIDDYQDSEFSVDVEDELDGHKLKLTFRAELKNDGLNELLKKGDVEFLFHLESSEVGYRTAIKTNKKEKVFSIDLEQLGVKLEICSFLVARKDLATYSNSKLHEDYEGFTFSIEEGCVLGIGTDYIINLQKDNELGYTPSIFSIVRDKRENAQGMVVDYYNNSKIVIRIPSDSYNKLDLIKENMLIQSTLISLIYLPALLYVLEEVSKTEEQDRYPFEDLSWYRSIDNALMEIYNCNFDSGDFKNLNYLEVAQKLINVPFDDALNYTYRGFQDDYEDEDEE